MPESPIEIRGPAKLTFTLVQKHGGWNSDDNQNFLLGRYRFSITEAASIPEQTVSREAESILRRPSADWTESDWQTLFTQWRQTQPSLVEMNEAIEQQWLEHPETSTQLVAQVLPSLDPRSCSREVTFSAHGNGCNRIRPSFCIRPRMTPVPPRLRFARWLASPDSPTTARVIVNRFGSLTLGAAW